MGKGGERRNVLFAASEREKPDARPSDVRAGERETKGMKQRETRLVGGGARLKRIGRAASRLSDREPE